MSQDQHNQIMEEIKKINENMEDINNKLEPINEMYLTARNLGIWAKWFLGFLLLISSLYLAIRQIFKQ